MAEADHLGAGSGAASGSAPRLAIDHLSFTHRGAPHPALEDVSLSLAPGEILAVVGPSGSGKSTLLHLVAGLLQPQQGAITLDGSPLTPLPPERRPVAMVFQNFALLPHLSVRGNIEFGLRVRRTPRGERRQRVEEAAELLGLTQLLDRHPWECSGGERQRTALARALVRDPELFCLDEPLAALDPLLRTDARRELRALLRAEGRSAILVTHDQLEALTLGDRVAVLRAGRLEQCATPTELYDHPATPFVASFLGTPPMSLLEARDGVGGPLRALAPLPGPCTLGVRPEHVEIREPRPGDPAEILARVDAVEDLGHELHLTLELSPGRLVARLSRSHPLARPGETVAVAVDPVHVHCWER